MDTIKRQKPMSKAEKAYYILLAKLEKIHIEKEKEKQKEAKKQKEREEYLCK